jgi:hypothetical protein
MRIARGMPAPAAPIVRFRPMDSSLLAHHLRPTHPSVHTREIGVPSMTKVPI